jgi:Nitronate monooxygenase
MSGSELLARSRSTHPDAKRILLIDYGDPHMLDVIARGMALGHAEHYLTKPWRPRQHLLYPVVGEALVAWTRANWPGFELVRIVSDRWDPASYELRDVLERNNVPYGFYDRDSAAGAELVRCPLTQLAEKIGAGDGSVTDIWLPRTTEMPSRGHSPLLPMLESVLGQLDLPVLAAGGIGDGRAFTAVLAAGAGGARAGTRFVAASESGAIPTTSRPWPMRSPARPRSPAPSRSAPCARPCRGPGCCDRASRRCAASPATQRAKRRWAASESPCQKGTGSRRARPLQAISVPCPCTRARPLPTSPPSSRRRRLFSPGAPPEIPLLVTPGVSALPTLDSTRLLARAALEVAIGRRPMPTWRGGPAGD